MPATKENEYGYLRDYLKNLIEQQKLGLLGAFNLAKREGEAAYEVLVYASQQNQFPFLPGLNKHLKEKGFNSYYPFILGKKGIIANNKKGGRNWFLSMPVLSSLEELYRLEGGQKGQSEAPVTETQTPKPVSGKLFGKRGEIWEIINQEKVGNNFLLTSGFVRQLAERTKCSPNYVWDTLRVLEKRGLCVRKRLPDRGILINFSVSSEPEPTQITSKTRTGKEGRVVTILQLARRLREEIASIQKQLTALGNLRREKENLLALIKTYLN
jgi:hypothetical protein